MATLEQLKTVAIVKHGLSFFKYESKNVKILWYKFTKPKALCISGLHDFYCGCSMKTFSVHKEKIGLLYV